MTDGDQPYMGKWWVPGLQIGYEHSFVHQVADFLESLGKGTPCGPTFRDALETQKVCDAVCRVPSSRSRKNVCKPEKNWVPLLACPAVAR